MELDKDKVVEAARAYISRIDAEIAKDPHIVPWDEYYTLKEALNPPPARPSKEECIEWLEKGRPQQEFDIISPRMQLREATIEYLKEPSLQLVENTGVKPEYKEIVVFFRDGGIDHRTLKNPPLRWDLDRWNSCGFGMLNDIIKYIILE